MTKFCPFSKLLLFFYLLLTFFNHQLFAQESLPSHDIHVAKIEVKVKCLPSGTNFDQASLLSRLKTKEGSLFRQADFDIDLKTLAIEFEGVEPELQFVGNQVFITLEIALKQTVRCIHWEGNQKVKTSRLVKELKIQPGTIFERHCFNEAFHKLRIYYVKKGFFEAELSYTVTPVPHTNEVDIQICIVEGRSGKIKKICFEGFTEKEEECILDKMVTKEYSFFTSWMDDTGTYNQDLLDHDRLQILDHLHNEGYADARVSLSVLEEDDPDAPADKDYVHIKICAQKGERYFFGRLQVCGNKLFTCEQLYEHFCIYEGDPYSPDKLRKTIQSLQTLYGSKGYIEASISHRPHLDECHNLYHIEFHVQEGNEFRVGMIKVCGNNVTKTSVILHESLLTPGDIFDIRKLEATECRLLKVGYFKCVNVYPVKSQLQDHLCGHYRDVHIEVEETTTGNFGVFFGFSTIENLFGGIEVTERNFNYEGLNNLFGSGPCSLRGGGEYLQLRTSIGQKASSYLLRWVKPYFMDTNWIVGFDIERSFNRSISSDYNIETTGLKLHATYPINRFVRIGCHYRIEDSRIRVIGTSGPLTVEEEEEIFAKYPGNSTKAQNEINEINYHRATKRSIQEEVTRDGIVSAVGTTINYDSTDCTAKPTKGLRSELALELAGLGGPYKFASVNYINTYYLSLSRRGVMKYRADFKFIQPYGDTVATDIPLSERYFLGGELSVRGYRPYSIGPVFANNDPRGGVSSVLFSQEYLHHICNRVDAFVFIDAGSLSLNTFQFGPFRASYGGGLRLEFINGIPIIVGMGFPVNALNKSDVKRFFFSLGGRF